MFPGARVPPGVAADEEAQQKQELRQLFLRHSKSVQLRYSSCSRDKAFDHWD
jgi:hypothetical protein